MITFEINIMDKSIEKLLRPVSPIGDKAVWWTMVYTLFVKYLFIYLFKTVVY